MSAARGGAMQHLSFLQQAAQTIKNWGLFPLLRGAESRAAHLPRIGQSRTRDKDILELRQTPTLAFPPHTLDALDLDGRRPVVYGYWMGLTGPMGPLPLHLTEFATYEQRYGKKRPFGRFLDLLAGRMLQYFYRAWADSQPAVQADRPDEDRFAHYLAALSGAAEGVSPDAAFPGRARTHYAGHFASRRSASGIQDALTHLLGSPARVKEYQPRWRRIETEDRTVLGQSFAGLGHDAVLGASTWGVMDAFRIVIRCGDMREYERFLPSGPKFQVAAEALQALAPSHLEWDIELEIPENKVRPARLDGRARLGWTSWMSPDGENPELRADTHLGDHSRRLKTAYGGNAI